MNTKKESLVNVCGVVLALSLWMGSLILLVGKEAESAAAHVAETDKKLSCDLTNTVLKAPSTAAIGSNILITNIMRNMKPPAPLRKLRANPCANYYYIHTNTTDSPLPANKLIGQGSFLSILIDRTRTNIATYPVPGTITPGANYLIAVANGNALAGERPSCKGNNTSSVPITINSPP